MKRLAIIPARGGSKRLPRKNVLPFLGKPMLIWTCEAARDCGAFDRILVSTEDPEIAAIAREHDFEVDVRSEHLATDAATCAQVCLDLLDRLEEQGSRFEVLCCLYATAPLRRAEDVLATVSLLDDDKADFAFAVCGYGNSPYQMLIANTQGFLAPAWPLVARKKSQELPVPVIGNGSTYAARVTAFRGYQDFYGPRLVGHSMPRMRSVDIDTAEDFDMALCFAEWLQKKGEL